MRSEILSKSEDYRHTSKLGLPTKHYMLFLPVMPKRLRQKPVWSIQDPNKYRNTISSHFVNQNKSCHSFFSPRVYFMNIGGFEMNKCYTNKIRNWPNITWTPENVDFESPTCRFLVGEMYTLERQFFRIFKHSVPRILCSVHGHSDFELLLMELPWRFQGQKFGIQNSKCEILFFAH